MRRFSKFCLLCITAVLLFAACGLSVSASGAAADQTEESKDPAVQQILDRLSGLTDQTRSMSDDELSEYLQSIAGEYRLTLNQEQLDFLISACRGLEKANTAGNTVQDYGQKVSAFAQAMQSVLAAIQKMLSTVSGFLQNLISAFA